MLSLSGGFRRDLIHTNDVTKPDCLKMIQQFTWLREGRGGANQQFKFRIWVQWKQKIRNKLLVPKLRQTQVLKSKATFNNHLGNLEDAFTATLYHHLSSVTPWLKRPINWENRAMALESISWKSELLVKYSKTESEFKNHVCSTPTDAVGILTGHDIEVTKWLIN